MIYCSIYILSLLVLTKGYVLFCIKLSPSHNCSCPSKWFSNLLLHIYRNTNRCGFCSGNESIPSSSMLAGKCRLVSWGSIPRHLLSLGWWQGLKQHPHRLQWKSHLMKFTASSGRTAQALCSKWRGFDFLPVAGGKNLHSDVSNRCHSPLWFSLHAQEGVFG